MDAFDFTPEQARNARARREDVRRHAGAGHALQIQHRIARLRGERPDQRGHLLVGGDFFLYDQDIVGIPLAVLVEKSVEVLLHFTSRCSRGGRNSGVKMSAALGLLVNLKAMPTWSIALSRRFMST